MDALIAIKEATKYTRSIKNNLKPELASLITDEFQTEEFWMDRISPTAWFASERDLIGYVYSVMMVYIQKQTKTSTIQFTATNVLDAWTEINESNKSEANSDFIKLKNGVMITISDLRIRVFNADDIEEKKGMIEFKDIPTRPTK